MRREFLHGIDEGGDVVRVDARRDAVPEVEHVAVAVAETLLFSG